MPTRQELVLQFMVAFAANGHVIKLMHEYGNNDTSMIVKLAGEWADAYLASL